MHYKNGRLAKEGDKVVHICNGIPAAGLIHSLNPGSTTCNGRLATITHNDAWINISDCLHVEDVQAGPHQPPKS